MVADPTGVVAFNIDGHTLHPLMSLPMRQKFKDLDSEKLTKIQQSFSDVQYITIDDLNIHGGKDIKWTDIFTRPTLIMHRILRIFLPFLWTFWITSSSHGLASQHY